MGVLAALVFLTYSNTFSNGFVWDDHEQIEMNPALRASASWQEMFLSDSWNRAHRDEAARSNYYRPLQMVTYRLTAQMFGLDPRNLHWLSVVLQLATTLVAFLVLWKLSQRLSIAFASAALFAVYPVHCEAVDWISAMPELGCTLCVLVALGLFLLLSPPRGGAQGFKLRWQRLLLWCMSLASFAAALLWKETAAVLPLLIATYVMCFAAGTAKQRLLRGAWFSLPYWCVLAGYVLVRLRALGFVATRQRIWELTPVQAGLSMLHLMAQYWWKLALPIHLNAYYTFSPIRSAWDSRAIASVVFLAAVILAVGYSLRRVPLVAFATLWVCISLLPVMNIYAVGRNVFAERYLYLPSVGFCLLAALMASVGIQYLPERARLPISALLLGAAVVWFSLETWQRNRLWADDRTLFQTTLVSSPDAPFVQFMAAATEKDGGSTLAAEGHYLEAIRLAQAEQPPDFLDLTRSYEGLASLYTARGDYDRARNILMQWRTTVPGEPAADIEEGLLLLRAGQWQQAEPLLKRASVRAPQNENVWNALGLLAWEYQKNLDEAMSCFSRALAIHTARDEFGASLHNNLGGVYGDRGEVSLAIAQLQDAVAIAPENPEYHTNLATAMAAAGRIGDAVLEDEAALKIDPGYVPARNLLRQLQEHPPAH